jgi:Kef-type K+ transport system membrane component KefB
MENYPSELLLIVFVATLAPLLAEWSAKYRQPVVVLEVILGILIGPHVFKLANLDGVISTLSELGLAFLLFMVGLEIDVERIRGKPLSMAVMSWLLSFTLAIMCMFFFSKIGFITTPPLLAAVALSTTALGILIPILRDRGELATEFGKHMIAVSAMAEFGPLLIISFVVIPTHSTVLNVLLMVVFTIAALFVAFIALNTQSSRLLEVMSHTMQSSGQLPVRLCILVQVLFVTLAAKFGFNIVIGAFTAGLLVGLVTKGEGGELLRHKLDAMGYGFFIPIFFIVVGMKFDLGALWSVPFAPFQLLLFLGLMLVIRGVPVLLYRKELSIEEQISFAFYSATGLPLILIITEIGVSTGLMPPNKAAILVGAGMISVLLFPALALKLRAKLASAINSSAVAK